MYVTCFWYSYELKLEISESFKPSVFKGFKEHLKVDYALYYEVNMRLRRLGYGLIVKYLCGKLISGQLCWFVFCQLDTS